MRTIGNLCDSQAVAIKKEISHMLQVVGHVPRRISSICLIFIRRGGITKCTVTGCHRYSSDLSQRDREVPCKLTFILSPRFLKKKLLKSTLSVKVGDIEAETPIGISCSDGTPNGKVSSGEEQDAQSEQSALIYLTNFENHFPQKRPKHIDVE